MIRYLSSALLAGACALGFAVPALADSFDVLHVFQGRHDGGMPDSALTPDGQGNFYGTTSRGGSKTCGCGSVFRIAADGTLTTIYSFEGGSDGAQPFAGVTFGPDGALYGTTVGGGGSSWNCYGFTCGTVFRVTPDGQESVLHRFAGMPDGGSPEAAVILDREGNIYGTTTYGGNGSGGFGYGTVFKISPDGTETLLHVFNNDGRDGMNPAGKLAMDKTGNLYGVTTIGGKADVGTVFKLDSSGSESILHPFRGNKDGSLPGSDLMIDKKGNVYGTTKSGGSSDGGTVFKLTSAGVYTVLHAFQAGDPGGYYPLSGVIADKRGNLYGTTSGGGIGFGTAYKLAPDGTLWTLHNFTSNGDGREANATLAADGLNLYGTDSEGGSYKGETCSAYGCGVVFRMKR